jgi:hypothetical protein
MFRHKRPPRQPATVEDAVELLQRRLGPRPDPEEEAASAEFRRRMGAEIGKAEFALVRAYLDDRWAKPSSP